MRILQLIDSLEAGGAERMAVNYANALSTQIEFSALVSTRAAGPLKEQLHSSVSYLCLDKKSSTDIKALFRLRAFIKKHRVQVIHAHSSSFFWAVLAKLLVPRVKVIWHNHFGIVDIERKKPNVILQHVSKLFCGIIAVNESLAVWSRKKLEFKNVIYLSNFTVGIQVSPIKTILSGEQGKRIVCLANLRKEKNHFFLLQVANRLRQTHPDWTLHLVGKKFKDDYSERLEKKIVELNLERNVFLYDSCSDTDRILEQSSIGILTSVSEGFPVSLLEYGWHKKPVVVTNVGQVSSVVVDSKNGFLVAANDVNGFYERLVCLLNDKQMQERFGNELYQKIAHEFSAAAVIKKYLQWLKETVIHE